VYNTVRLKKDVKAPTEANAAKFFYGHGDSYVGQIEKGGEFIAIYTFYTETFNAQADLTTQLSASGISEDGEIDAKVAAAIQLVYDQFKLRKSLKSLLLGYKGIAPASVQEIIDFGRGLSARDPENPIVLNYRLTGYENVPNFPPVPWQAIIDNRELFMSSLAPARAKLRLLRNQINTILAVYDYYGVEVDQADLTRRRDAVDAAVSQLQTLVNQVDRQPAVVVEMPKSTDLESLTWGTPILTYSQVDSRDGLPKMGGDGGSDIFTDVQLSDVLSGTRVAALQLKGDKKIDQLITTYTNRQGSTWTRAHAEGGGNYSLRIALEPGQRLQYIYGTTGDNVVTWLEFWFQKNVVLQYPPRTIKGAPFEYRFDVTDALIGFNGRAGQYLDQIAPLVARFAPVTFHAGKSA